MIEGKPQVYYYDKLDIGDILGLPDSKLYMGIVAVNSEILTSNHRLTNYYIYVVIPSPELTEAIVEKKNNKNIYESDEIFKINIFVYNGCGTRYFPIEWDSKDDIVNINTPKKCAQISVEDGTERKIDEKGPAYIFQFKCQIVGKYRFDFKYKNGDIKNYAEIEIIAGKLNKMNISFPFGNKGTIDAPFYFDAKPLDSALNLANSTEDEIIEKISVEWPVALDSKRETEAKLQSNGVYRVRVDADKVGIYQIKGSHILNPEIPKFDISKGAPNPDNSLATFSNNGIDKYTTDDIKVGTLTYLKVEIKDKGGNSLNPNDFKDEIIAKLAVNGKHFENLNTKKFTDTYLTFEAIMKKKGTANPSVTYSTSVLNCVNCQTNVISGDADFKNSEIYPWNNITTKFEPSAASLKLNKEDIFQFLFVIRDLYKNDLDNLLKGDYTATLSGNNMNELNLCLSNFANGLKLEICPADAKSYQSLVGRKNYQITVTQKSDGKKKQRSLELISDGSDKDQGNGDVDTTKTTWWWSTPLTPSGKLIAGQTYHLIVQLNTNENLRITTWVPVNEITLQWTIPLNSIDSVTTAAKLQDIGRYDFTFVLKKAIKERKPKILVKTKADANTHPEFEVIPAEAYKGNFLASQISSANQIKETLVKVYNELTLNLFDRFGNPNDFSSSSSNIIFTHSSKKVVGTGGNDVFYSFVPAIEKKNLGIYKVSFTPEFDGGYIISSIFWKEIKDNRYLLSVIKGPPEKTTEASITNDISVNLLTGVILNFRLIPKDLNGNVYTKVELGDFYKKLTVSLKYPSGLIKNLPISDSNVETNGEILINIPTTVNGRYTFSPKRQIGVNDFEDVNCAVCSAFIHSNKIDPTKIIVKHVKGGVPTTINKADLLILDNNNYIPVFILEFYDKFNNRKELDAGFSAFTTNIKVNGGLKTAYPLEETQTGKDRRFTIRTQDEDSYKKELKNENCQLSFKSTDGTINIEIIYGKVTLKGSNDDNKFTIKPIDINSVKIIPNNHKFVAGTFVQSKIELRAADGKLQNSYYNDPSASFQFPTLKTYTISKGKLKGTYIISFTSKTLDNNREIAVKFENTTGIFLEAKEKLTFSTIPGDLDYLEILKPAEFLINCVSGTFRIFDAKGYDKNNLVATGMESSQTGYSFTPANNFKSTKIELYSQGVARVNVECKTAGKVDIRSLKFLNISQGHSKIFF